MDVGVVMLVKNEVKAVEAALAPILDQLAEIIVYDTGSTDGTQDVLRERLHIEPLSASLDAALCGNLASLRNQGFARLKSPWQMTLDADERLASEGFRELRKTRIPDEVGGLFLCWRNHLTGVTVFEDYKCSIFRKGLNHSGLVHDTVQPSLRKARLRAQWSDAVILEHFPDTTKAQAKRQRYQQRLQCAMVHDPDSPRYPWFYGYTSFLNGEHREARKWLRRAAESTHPLFPVERLNARIILATEAALSGEIPQAREHLHLAQDFFTRARSDFEIAVNRWIAPWLAEASSLIDAGRPQRIGVPRFAC